MKRLATLEMGLGLSILRMPFDPDAFMNATIDQPLDFERTLIPEGEFRMFVDDFDSSIFESIEFVYKRGPNVGQPGTMHKGTFPIVVDDDKVRAALQVEKARIYYQCTLDYDDQTGQLLFGPNKNIDLGRLRHAVGQDAPGPWAVSQLRGAGPFMGKVKHRTGNRRDNTKFTIAEIERMSPIK